jgi:hypothetical protein
MSPTVFRAGPYRFFFFSREEPRPHIHVQANEGEAKFWIEPEIQLAKNYGFKSKDLRQIEALVIEHREEIQNAWNRHFPGG